MFDSDIALLGTGVAPLVAANHLLVQGKSILLLNPDLDFFLEDSELPLDPMLLEIPTPARIIQNSPENALEQLRPDFPGAIELWSPEMEIGKIGFHDSSAPHVRKRARLWVSSPDKNKLWNWPDLEDLYVETSDAGLDPQISDNLSTIKRFPGFSNHSGTFQSLCLPKVGDVDTARYRNGLLEFVRERLGPDKIISAMNQLELMPDGIRFYANGSPRTARLKEGMLVFWTPRLSNWIFGQGRRLEMTPPQPKGIRFWETWLINSRDIPNPSVVGMFGDMVVWADFEGAPSFEPRNQGRKDQNNPKLPCLAVLRTGPLKTHWEPNSATGSMASAESFAALSNLCHGFLRWDRFSVRSLRVQALFESQANERPWMLSKSSPPTWVIPGSDGPLVDVVRTARAACDYLLK